MRKRRHAVRHRIFARARRISPVQYHPDRIDRGMHFDGLIVRQRRVVRQFSFTVHGMASGALLVVKAFSFGEHLRCIPGKLRIGRIGRGGVVFRQAFQVYGHRMDIVIGHVLEAVVSHLRHRAVHRAAIGYAGLQQVHDVLDRPVSQPRFLVRRKRWRIPVLHGNQSAFEGFRFG